MKNYKKILLFAFALNTSTYIQVRGSSEPCYAASLKEFHTSYFYHSLQYTFVGKYYPIIYSKPKSIRSIQKTVNQNPTDQEPKTLAEVMARGLKYKNFNEWVIQHKSSITEQEANYLSESSLIIRRPLIRAAYIREEGDAQATKILLDAKADVNGRNPSTEETSLHRAAFWPNLNTIPLLLQAKADVNALTNNFETPLDIAMLSLDHDNSQKRAIDLLKQAGGKTYAELQQQK